MAGRLRYPGFGNAALKYQAGVQNSHLMGCFENIFLNYVMIIYGKDFNKGYYEKNIFHDRSLVRVSVLCPLRAAVLAV